MIENLLHTLFYLSGAILAIVCVYTAHNMTKTTCVCIRWCFSLILLGLIGLVFAVYYDFGKSVSLLLVMPIFWGVTGWLMFDRYRAHDKMRRIYDEIMATFKEWKRRISGFFREEAVSE
jgi:steroid 5-alpha reductase family enzyme